MNFKIEILDFLTNLILCHTVFSPLGSRGCTTTLRLRFCRIFYWFKNFTWKKLCPKGGVVKKHYPGVPLIGWLSLPRLIPKGSHWSSGCRYLALSPEGSCENRARMGSGCFYLRFDYSELLARNVLWWFKNTKYISLFKNLKLLYCDG